MHAMTAIVIIATHDRNMSMAISSVSCTHLVVINVVSVVSEGRPLWLWPKRFWSNHVSSEDHLTGFGYNAPSASLEPDSDHHHVPRDLSLNGVAGWIQLDKEYLPHLVAR